VSEDRPRLVVERPTAILTQISLIHPIAAVSDRQIRTAAGALDTITPANLLQQVRCSRFRHEPAYWEHIGHRWRGALALFDFQPLLSPSTISFPRAYYDSPRRATGEDVAAVMDCAPSTAAKHLRKAESKLVTGLLQR
jgi:hypothetical protein